ncbi:MAG: hypothetical protein ACOY81_02895 [Bacillota bacterium]|uniref:hypothetical protein n=1 Tax=Desulfurispora thermophila TaxID=265470 RepID=UPI00036ED744|nr:hypothetical protein [Desulfurispora thermophila]
MRAAGFDELLVAETAEQALEHLQGFYFSEAGSGHACALPRALLVTADRALYQAKRAGRNQIALALPRCREDAGKEAELFWKTVLINRPDGGD